MSGTVSEHTPTPWVRIVSEDWAVAYDGSFQWITLGVDGDTVPTALVPAEYRSDRDGANADFIVQAVNSHADLVAALEAVLNLRRTDDRSIVYAPQVVAQIQAALDKARAS